MRHTYNRPLFVPNKQIYDLLVPRSKVHLSYRPIQFYNGQPEIFRIMVARFLDSFDSIFNVLIVVFLFLKIKARVTHHVKVFKSESVESVVESKEGGVFQESGVRGGSQLWVNCKLVSS